MNLVNIFAEYVKVEKYLPREVLGVNFLYIFLAESGNTTRD